MFSNGQPVGPTSHATSGASPSTALQVAPPEHAAAPQTVAGRPWAIRQRQAASAVVIVDGRESSRRFAARPHNSTSWRTRSRLLRMTSILSARIRKWRSVDAVSVLAGRLLEVHAVPSTSSSLWHERPDAPYASARVAKFGKPASRLKESQRLAVGSVFENSHTR